MLYPARAEGLVNRINSQTRNIFLKKITIKDYLKLIYIIIIAIAIIITFLLVLLPYYFQASTLILIP